MLLVNVYGKSQKCCWTDQQKVHWQCIFRQNKQPRNKVSIRSDCSINFLNYHLFINIKPKPPSFPDLSQSAFVALTQNRSRDTNPQFWRQGPALCTQPTLRNLHNVCECCVSLPQRNVSEHNLGSDYIARKQFSNIQM